MNTQNLVKQKLAQPESITIVRQVLEAYDSQPRSAIAQQVCERLELFNARGNPQQASCLKALRELESAGHFELPTSRRCAKPGSPRRLDGAVEPPVDVPAQAGEVRGLELIRIETHAQVRTWNELMEREHPRGAGPLVGVQVRYLIGSSHGWLGGLGFGASALQLKDRERWIGWDAQTRRKHLHRIIGLSRFLIRATVNCRNLASHVLGMALRQLPGDVETRYGYRPWLVETFVETERFRGTCFRAANWIEVGHTRGVGARTERTGGRRRARPSICIR